MHDVLEAIELFMPEMTIVQHFLTGVTNLFRFSRPKSPYTTFFGTGSGNMEPH